jgi:Flp pilus assembly protein TadG
MKTPYRIRETTGAAAVEAALLLIPLVVLALGIAEYGRAFFQYDTLAKSARDATRYLTTVPPGANHTEAACLAVTGTTDCSGAPLADGLTTAQVQICDAATCPGTHQAVPATGNGGPATGAMNLVTVTVNGYTSQNFLPWPFPSVTFEAISNTMRQAI